MRTIFLLLSLLALTASAHVSPDQVLIVVNDASPVSVAIGNYYRELHQIPAANVFHLPKWTPTKEEINRQEYNLYVRDPLIELFEVTAPELKNQIGFIVTTKGVPLMIWHWGGSIFDSRRASVDSELTQLFTGTIGEDGQSGRIGNPYYGVDQPFDTFSSPNISYAVFRLDAFDGPINATTGLPRDLQLMIDRGQQPAREGTIVFDLNSTKKILPDLEMMHAANLMRSLGFDVIEDYGDAMVTSVPDILAYFSWGSNDPWSPPPPYWGENPPGSGIVYPGTFVPGAIAHTYVSTNGRTFTHGNENYGQSLIAGLIHLGVSGASGHVYEPNVDAVTNAEYLLRGLAKGYQLGEAFYQAVPLLSWMTVVVCDPLVTYDFSPELHSASPDRGPAKGGTTLSLTGWGFTNSADTTVLVDGRPCTQVTVMDGQHLTAVTPPGEIVPAPPAAALRLGGDAVDVRIVNTRGQAALESAFTYLPGK